VYATSKAVQIFRCTGVVHSFIVTGRVQDYTDTAVEQGNRITELVQVYYRGVEVVQVYTATGVLQG
jgi:hypothetical protein